MGLSDVFKIDLALLHAPSVLGFRESQPMSGPVADVIPSTDQFEMYPVGMTSIADYLERNGYNVRIVNLAYLMLRRRSYDPVRHLRRVHAPVFGIDLHWLPHADGALGVAEIVKRVHPGSKVLLGGLSSTYYHEELIQNPNIDFVIRGDSTEEPCRQLLQALREKSSLETVENLTWKTAEGEVRVNPLSFVPPDLDYVDVPAYRRTVRSVFKYWNLPNAVPYLEWMRYPTTMLLLARGCTLDCSTCGGSRSAYRLFCNRQTPAYRSAEKLVADVRTIESFSRAPVFVVGDPRMGGHARAERLFDLLAKHKPRNEMVFELFYPANERLFEMIERSVPRWNLQVTIESPLQHLRQLNGKFGCSNEEIESTIASALAHGCSKLDIFYMVGIPGQTVADAMATVPYCDALADKLGNDPRVHFFVAPLGPFLDPGSRAFEDPAFGYKHYARTLADHRQALKEPVWDRVLSFASDAMSRAEIVSSTYAVAEGLNDLKLRHGLIDAPTHAALALELEAATTAMRELETAARLGPEGREQAIESARQAIAASRLASMRGKEELHWRDQVSFRVTPRLLFDVVTGPLDQFVLGLGRALGRYDRHVYSPRLERSPEVA